MKHKTFEEFWRKNFKGEYIEDGNWQRYELLGREYGCSPKPRDKSDFEEYSYLMCESIWDHLEQENQKLKEEVKRENTSHNYHCKESQRKNGVIDELKVLLDLAMGDEGLDGIATESPIEDSYRGWKDAFEHVAKRARATREEILKQLENHDT